MTDNPLEKEGLEEFDTQPLPRAATMLDERAFHKVYTLMLDKMWLRVAEEALLELWNLCYTESQQNLVIALLNRFTCHTDGELANSLTQIANKICKEWELDPSSSYIVATCDATEPDGSQMVLQKFKNKFTEFDGWRDNNFINNLSESIKKIQDRNTVVLFDDFIGTGKTFKKKIEEYRKKIQAAKKVGVTIKICAVAAMNVSKKILDTLGAEYFVPIWLDKGISDYYKDEELKKAMTDMGCLENLLKPKYDSFNIENFRFGFGKCEALFSIGTDNVPNNVFPIFWWKYLKKDNTKRKLIFARI